MAKDPTKQPLDFEAMITGGSDLWRQLSQRFDVIEKQLVSAADDPTRLRDLAKYVTRTVYKHRPMLLNA